MRWKSLADNPPKDGTYCLFTNERKQCILGEWEVEGEEVSIRSGRAEDVLNMEGVTHWIAVDELMRLPKR